MATTSVTELRTLGDGRRERWYDRAEEHELERLEELLDDGDARLGAIARRSARGWVVGALLAVIPAGCVAQTLVGAWLSNGITASSGASSLASRPEGWGPGVQALLAAYLLTAIVGLLGYARIGRVAGRDRAVVAYDRTRRLGIGEPAGRKGLGYAGILALVVGTALAVLTTHPGAAVGFRAEQGLGAGLLATALAGSLPYDPASRLRARAGQRAGFALLASVLGFVVVLTGGLLAGRVSGRSFGRNGALEALQTVVGRPDPVVAGSLVGLGGGLLLGSAIGLVALAFGRRRARADRLERSGLERSGLEQSGLERSGLERSGLERSGGVAYRIVRILDGIAAVLVGGVAGLGVAAFAARFDPTRHGFARLTPELSWYALPALLALGLALASRATATPSAVPTGVPTADSTPENTGESTDPIDETTEEPNLEENPVYTQRGDARSETERSAWPDSASAATGDPIDTPADPPIDAAVDATIGSTVDATGDSAVDATGDTTGNSAETSAPAATATAWAPLASRPASIARDPEPRADESDRTADGIGESVPQPRVRESGLIVHVRQADGAPVDDVVLTLCDLTGRQIARSTSSGAGRHRVEATEPGSYLLIASGRGFHPHASVVDLEVWPTELDITLVGESGLTGVIRRMQGDPLGAATVTLTTPRGDVVVAQLTGDDGSYSFGELVPGSYTMTVTARAYRPAALIVHVPETGIVRQDVALVGGAALHGVVRTRDTGRPLPDARVTLIEASGKVVATTTADADGAYRFGDVAEGDYTVVATTQPPAASTLRISGGEDAEHDLELAFPDAD